MNPQVTVIVPAYNHERYAEECIRSIGAQTFKDFQWIVVDDCSRDNTTKILKKLQTEFGFELIIHEKNIGLANTLNEIIQNYAKGQYLSICASDDVWFPNKLEVQFSFLVNHPEYEMCYSRCFYINEKSEKIGIDNYEKYGSGDIFKDVLCRKYQPGIFTLLKTDVIKELGYYKPGIIAEDYYMNCLITHSYKVALIDEIVGAYRVAPLERKRNPMALVLSHRETVDLFKNEPIYPEAVVCWELYSARTLAKYTRYKFFAILKLFKNILNLNTPEKKRVSLSICKQLIINWRKIAL